MTQSQTDLRNGPDANGLFGAFGGRYVAETLMPLILELAREYEAAKIDPAFNEELAYFQRDYVGRPSPLYFAERLTEFCGGAKIYLKREELNHTGAHKINNCIGTRWPVGARCQWCPCRSRIAGRNARPRWRWPHRACRRRSRR